MADITKGFFGGSPLMDLPVISLFIFFTFFTVVTIMAMKMKDENVEKLANMPLDEEKDNG